MLASTLAYGHRRLRSNTQLTITRAPDIRVVCNIANAQQGAEDLEMEVVHAAVLPGLDPDQVAAEMRQRRLRGAFPVAVPDNMLGLV